MRGDRDGYPEAVDTGEDEPLDLVEVARTDARLDRIGAGGLDDADAAERMLIAWRAACRWDDTPAGRPAARVDPA